MGTPPVETCRRAAAALDALPGLRLRALSRWYLTEPVPPSGQPDYVNAVAVLQRASRAPQIPILPPCSPHCRRSRRGQGRVRGEPNAARTLDLDIIAMGQGGQMVRATPDPVLPHPRAHQRAFVLVPLLDVAPGWVHPLLRRRARDLLRDLPSQGIEPL